jgi:hypothetical protein
MSARRPVLVVLALSCVLVCALVARVGSAEAVMQFGSYGSGAGQLRGVEGVAVDQASGDVYVADAKNKRIDEFEASGSFVRAWGWGVLNEAKELQTCTTTCGPGIEGNGPGQLTEGPMGVAVDNDPLSSSYGDVYVFDPSNHHVEKFDSSGGFLLEFEVQEFSDNGPVIAVGPNGRVYVGAKAEVQVFEPSGVLSEKISLAGLSSTASVTALTVDGSGDVFVKDSGVAGVREFEANGTEKATRFDASSETVTALTVDGSGDLFVGEASALNSPATFSLLEYSPSGEELASFGNESALAFRFGIAFASVLGVGEIYVTNLIESAADVSADVSVVPLPVSGPPAIEPGSVTATQEQRGHATVGAKIDPDGNATSYRVEYVSEADFQASGYSGASSTSEVTLGPKFEEVPVSVALSELVPGSTYHYRFVATSSQGSETSLDETFQAIPPALIAGPWVTGVTDTSVTFAAEIDPLGISTEYRVEYGTSTAYGEVLTGSAGEGEAYLPVSFHRQDLTPGTLYHYRVLVHNEVGTFEGPDHTFTTQAAGGQELALADGRAWELVSPVDKGGALIAALQNSGADLQAAANGDAIAYPASEAVGEGVVSHFTVAQILSKRGPRGWGSQDVSSERIALPPEGTASGALSAGQYPIFSSDLSLALFEPTTLNTASQSPEATERSLYLRDSETGKFLPLDNSGDVPSGTLFGKEVNAGLAFYTATPDLSHVIFGTPATLTPEAVAPPEQDKGARNLYEWSADRLQLVNVLPGTPESPNGTSEPGASLGSYYGFEPMTARAISTDGRWVVWGNGGSHLSEGLPVRLYARDMVAKKSFQIGGDYPRFETMSADGSKVFFVETEAGHGGDLYVFDTATGTERDLTADHGANEHSANMQGYVMGASEDGSYVYFVARGVLANGAVNGADNVYVLHETGGVWSTTYIATLSPADSKSWEGRLPYVSSRVSPNGRYLTFMSEGSLTGYDNLDAISGHPDEEVYVYDALANRLDCASCNPTGARPMGVFDNRDHEDALFADLSTAWSHDNGTSDHWLAGSIPGWDQYDGEADLAPYQPRYLSDRGRLFFDSPDALVPQDTNGLEDAYEYEPAGVGSCTSAAATFSERSDGCVSLISSGQSADESFFLDASETGDDAFFATNGKLTGEDVDASFDVYDAHVCSEEAPCRAEPVTPPPCTSGDSCKAAPSPQPEIFGPTPSATFSGTGNVQEEAKPAVKKAKHKPKRHARKSKRKAKRSGKAHKARSGRKGGR